MTYRESGAAAFDQIKTVARKDDWGGLIGFLYQWIDRILPGSEIATLGSLSRKDSHLDTHFEGLLAKRYSGKAQVKWPDSNFVKRLDRLRRSMRKMNRLSDKIENRLPDLNPKHS